MRAALLLAAFVAVATAQFSCDNCDGAGNREARTGCRLFCYFSADGIVVSRQNLVDTFNRDKDTDAGITRPRWTELARSNLQLCDDEIGESFDLIASLGGGDANIMDESDINGLADLIQDLTGQTEVDKAGFQDVYALVYFFIGNDNCNIGL